MVTHLLTSSWCLCCCFHCTSSVKVEASVAQSCPALCNPWTEARQAPLPMGFCRQGDGAGRHSLLQGLFPTQGPSPASLSADAVPSGPPEELGLRRELVLPVPLPSGLLSRPAWTRLKRPARSSACVCRGRCRARGWLERLSRVSADAGAAFKLGASPSPTDPGLLCRSWLGPSSHCTRKCAPRTRASVGEAGAGARGPGGEPQGRVSGGFLLGSETHRARASPLWCSLTFSSRP